MTRRMLEGCGVAFAVVFTVLVAGPSGQAPAAKSQSAAPKKPAYTAPRTAWGDPDLQGTWNNGTITPLERPRGAGEKELLTKEEEEEINAAVRHPRDARKTVPRIERRTSNWPTTSSGGIAASRSAAPR